MKKVKKYRYQFSVVFALLLAWYLLALPKSLFDDPYSTVILDKEGRLLGASIARDGQWRFPQNDSVPDKFATALTLFEDEYYYWHPGINPVSLVRATWQNLTSGKVVSGGSTITMQVIRMSRRDKPRTILEKIIEISIALRLELKYSKNEILSYHASHAPFGGNVVGLSAATWRYFGREPYDLSWGEAALLAVLPNSPALIHPGRNREELLNKRNRLLDKLHENGHIDLMTCELAKSERIPEAPRPVPQTAPHLLTRVINDKHEGRQIKTTIDQQLQEKVSTKLDFHHSYLKGNEIYNAAAIVANVQTGEVLAYVGNVGHDLKSHGQHVDIITAPRSSGSILKPFLYAAMLQDGYILPTTLIRDTPIFIDGFAPKNFAKSYDGAVHADKALSRSLNVPAVEMLQEYRYEKFYSVLEDVGMTTLNHSADHYGLSMILGGAETTIWDIAAMYGSMARTLRNANNSMYKSNNFYPLHYSDITEQPKISGQNPLKAASIYHTLEALLEVHRPIEESSWVVFESSQKIAWKTGTSFGHRDAWAVGVTKDYVVAVWVGNADGEGRPGLTGVKVAAPVMFDIFDLLPHSEWFSKPFSEMSEKVICMESGQLAKDICPQKDTVMIIDQPKGTTLCEFHKLIHLDNIETFQVHSDCESVNSMVSKAWFILPPVQEYYYRAKNPDYQKLPQLRSDCYGQLPGQVAMDMIYPKPGAKIFIPTELDGTEGKAVFEVAHRRPATTIFWHLDDQFIGSTKRIHQKAISASSGRHKITLVDEEGVILARYFDVLTK